MVHGDDEPIQKQEGIEDQADIELDGNTEARIFNSNQAPMKETPFNVLLELKGVGPEDKVEEVGTKVEGVRPNKGGRSGMDLVTILDTAGNKIEEMKRAMQFLIKKLGRNDRLSVVTNFNGMANRICPLRQTTEGAVVEIANQVDALVAGSITNTQDALDMARQILGDRTLTGRRCAIMLMSDSFENNKSDVVIVTVSKVPLYIFGFGCDYNPEVIKKSYGGMFEVVPDLDNSSFAAFSTPLAELLGVAIEDLTLTITPLNSSKITVVNAENYPQIGSSDQISPVTIKFGSFYNGETRKVLVKLTLPKVDKRSGTNFLRVVYKYRVAGEEAFKYDQTELNVSRADVSTVTENEQVIAEEKRIASNIKEAIIFVSDAEKLKLAREQIVELTKQLYKVREELKKKEKYTEIKATEFEELTKAHSELGTTKDELLSKYDALQIKTKDLINKRFRSYLKNI